MNRVVYFLNAGVILIALMVLLGWQFDIELLKRPVYTWAAMNPVTALCILLSGISLYFSIQKPGQKYFKTASAVFALLVFGAGLAKLISLFTGFNIPIDTWLYTQKIIAEPTDRGTDLMSLNSAVTFLLYGSALLLLGLSNIRAKKTANFLALLVVFISLFSIIGFVYHVQEQTTMISLRYLAIHSVLCYISLGVAMLIANNKVGFMAVFSSPNISGKVARLLIPASLLIPVTLGYIRLFAQWHTPVSVEFGVSMLIISVIAVFLSLTWYVSVALNKADIARIAAEEELKQKNETLRVAEERLLLATEGTTAGIWDWVDMARDEEWWSPRFYELLGYTNNEIPASAKTFREIMHPDDFKQIEKKLDAHFKHQSKFEVEARLKTKSGAYKWFLGTGLVSRNETGLPVRMVGSIIDIDEQKRTHDYNEQQAALINMLPDGIIFYSRGMKFADINVGAEKMFDLKHDEVIGKDLNDFISFSLPSGEIFENSLAQLWQTGFYRNEIEITNRQSGKKVQVLVSIKKMENVYGGEPLFMAIYTDLTPLRVNEELKHALKSVESNNQYLEQFAYISAHDIKAPIITIAGLTKLMANSNAVKDEHKEILSMLTNSIGQIQRTNHALNSILELRKNLLTKEYAADRGFPLQTIFDDVKAGLQYAIEEANATVEADLNSLGEVSFNNVYVKSIFHNLLSNAIKYRDPVRPLHVKLTASKINDNLFRFIIEDNGLGFDVEKNRAKLFGIFKRFHTHVEGSGVGLHIVKSIVDEYNGTIDVQSTPGKGTQFVISFNKNILA